MFRLNRVTGTKIGNAVDGDGSRFLNVTILNVRPSPRARLRTAALLRFSRSAIVAVLIPDWASARI